MKHQAWATAAVFIALFLALAVGCVAEKVKSMNVEVACIEAGLNKWCNPR